MERFHWYRHNTEFPNVLFCRLKYEGEVDRNYLQTASDYVLSRHRLLSAKLTKCAGRLAWEADHRPVQEIRWHDSELNFDEFRAGPIDLEDEPGLRCDVFQANRAGDFVYQGHHAATDGLGGMMAVADCLVAYDNLCRGRPVESGLRRLDPYSIIRRNRIGLFRTGFWKRLSVQWIPIFGAIKFGLTSVAPLVTSDARDSSIRPLPPDYPTIITRPLPSGLYDRVQQFATEKNASTNEILLAALFLAVDHWQKDSEIDRHGKKIRIMVPISIRELSDRCACNRISFVQLDRGDKDFRHPSGLVWGINYELGIIRRYRFEKSLLIGLRLMSFVPGVLRWNVARRKRRATTFLTNVGAPFDRLRLERVNGMIKCGGLLLKQLELTAPYYDQTPAAFLVCGFAGTYSITINYDSRELDHADATSLLGEFETQITNLVNDA